MRKLGRLTLESLDCQDGKYNVGHLVKMDWPWVSKGEAQEILDIENSLLDTILEYVNETRDHCAPSGHGLQVLSRAIEDPAEDHQVRAAIKSTGP